MRNKTPSSPSDYIPHRAIDRIAEIDKGRRVLAERKVTGNERFFKDHFDGFPVLPGVLMLEGMVQTSSWLVRLMENFGKSQVRMTHLSQAKFAQLVRPGSTVVFESLLAGSRGADYDFKAKATVDSKTVSSARFRLTSSTIGEAFLAGTHLEPSVIERQRHLYARLTGAGY